MGAAWEIETSDEFCLWYGDLDYEESLSVSRSVDLLELSGPALGDHMWIRSKAQKNPNLKELRVQHRGRPLRILFVFDPRRIGYLILGGDKAGDSGWYESYIPVAERIYAKHLAEIERE